MIPFHLHSCGRPMCWFYVMEFLPMVMKFGETL